MMAQKQKAKKFLDVLASRVSLLILSSVTVWLGISVAKEAYRKHQVRQEIAQLKVEIIALGQKNSNLASLIDSFKDAETVELEAKKRLNLKKPGEEVAVILRDKNDELQNIVKADSNKNLIATEEEAALTNTKPSNPMKWWEYITEK